LFKLTCEKGFSVITFYFYNTDQFVSQKNSFLSYKLSVKFRKFTQFDFIFKEFTTFQRICNFFLTLRTLPPIVTEWNQSISPPCPTSCPITGPSPHMRQLLDSSTWHQQQLIQLAAFLTTTHTVLYFTAGISSFLQRNT
jgi:hypothetical protein